MECPGRHTLTALVKKPMNGRECFGEQRQILFLVQPTNSRCFLIIVHSFKPSCPQQVNEVLVNGLK